ncbi:MAG TPA: ATP-binding protein [Candidatus Omnitrophota bacterium]|nr:ATP-binding protein [Candidatus Omnitrophota bacterium]
MNPYNFSILCFGFCSLLLGLFVWLKRQDRVGQLYFVLSFFYAGWALPFSIKISDNISYAAALYAARMANCSAAFIPTVWLHFCLVYTKRDETHKKILKLFYAIPLLILAVSFTPWFVPGLRPILSFRHYATPGIFYYLMTLNYFIVIPLGFNQLFDKMKEVSREEREQLLGLFFSAFIGYLGGALTFLPIYGISFPQEGMFLLPIYPFALTYFMIKQKIFDIEELAQAAHRDKLTAIGVLAASINHEIKNPLFIIKGLAENCLERQKEGVFSNKEKALESANDAMKRSVEQADRAMDIIRRLSLFAKAGIDSEIKFEFVKIAEVLENILPLIRYELAAKNIVLTRDIPPNIPEVRADRRYLEEILFNLLVNACQAVRETGREGEIKVTAAVIARERSDRSNLPIPDLNKTGSLRPKNGLVMTTPDKVLITIQDNGPGIPEDKIKDVFRPFYTTKAEGTGLGLYITKQLVEKIGGRISVESQQGIGTTFKVILKAA